MVMRGHVRFQAQRAVMERDFLQHSRIKKRFHVLVNGSQRNGGDALFDLLVDQLRSRMLTGIDNGFVDYLTLESEGKALFFATAAEVVEGLRTQVGHSLVRGTLIIKQ